MFRRVCRKQVWGSDRQKASSLAKCRNGGRALCVEPPADNLSLALAPRSISCSRRSYWLALLAPPVLLAAALPRSRCRVAPPASETMHGSQLQQLRAAGLRGDAAAAARLLGGRTAFGCLGDGSFEREQVRCWDALIEGSVCHSRFQAQSIKQPGAPSYRPPTLPGTHSPCRPPLHPRS